MTRVITGVNACFVASHLVINAVIRKPNARPAKQNKIVEAVSLMGNPRLEVEPTAAPKIRPTRGIK
jgi:hypothetical protein